MGRLWNRLGKTALALATVWHFATSALDWLGRVDFLSHYTEWLAMIGGWMQWVWNAPAWTAPVGLSALGISRRPCRYLFLRQRECPDLALARTLIATATSTLLPYLTPRT